MPPGYEQVDDLLDSDDAIIILADGGRAIHNARGFGLSVCQHELLAVQIDRTVRALTRAETIEVGRVVAEYVESRKAA